MGRPVVRRLSGTPWSPWIRSLRVSRGGHLAGAWKGFWSGSSPPHHCRARQCWRAPNRGWRGIVPASPHHCLLRRSRREGDLAWKPAAPKSGWRHVRDETSVASKREALRNPFKREHLVCCCQRRQRGSCASASSTLRSVAAAISSGGTHAGNGTSTVRWAPEAVCCSSTAASRSAGKRSATRTSAGQIRRWTSVTLPSIRRVATTSPDARRRLRTAKISWPDAWPHQLPRIGSPAICSARFGTGPRADCNTTPCSHTQASGSIVADSTTGPQPGL